MLAGEATLRRNLVERVPQLGHIDEVSRTPMPGLYEIRVGTDIFYSDADGNFLLEGTLIDTRTKKNLTEARQDKLLAVDFSTLPVKDAFTVVRGNGQRKVAIFEDPNCGYCKRMERDIQRVDNVTIHVFLYPILGPDSAVKSRQIWCAADKGRIWVDWMARDKALPSAGGCDTSVLERNIALGRRHRISGTPTLILSDGSRVPGAVTAAQFEKLLAQGK
ncbi:MAG TPA: DsbC family protein [Ramlibacter sp.]|uniref:DsbC family protein n=1 Tax=Ramlibacter sp. TaxID=1917967 RepID=UPI002C6C1F83|nr:DsbC family protein [Ramlibacter sp.]HVZ45534.1 DsbC family protein [Ramlibacter sp.]